jgi:hypothetical protein
MRKGTLIGLAGAWLAIAGILRFAPIGEFWSNIVSGAVAIVVGASLGKANAANGVFSVLAGIWIVISAFLPPLLHGGGLLVNNLITGLVIMWAGFTVPPESKEAESDISRAA